MQKQFVLFWVQMVKKPSEAKVQQVYHQIIRQQKAALANNKKKK